MSGGRTKTIDWAPLIALRERRREQALQAMLAERRIVDEREAELRFAATEQMRSVDAKRLHWQTLAVQADRGGCDVAQLRDASAWSGALDARIARQAQAHHAAQVAADSAAAVLDERQRRLRQAAAGVESATQAHDRERTVQRRRAELRAEDASESLAVDAWAARRAS